MKEGERVRTNFLNHHDIARDQSYLQIDLIGDSDSEEILMQQLQ